MFKKEIIFSDKEVIIKNSNDPDIEYQETDNIILAVCGKYCQTLDKSLFSVESLKTHAWELPMIYYTEGIV